MAAAGSRFYLVVLGAIALGGTLGHFLPTWGVALKPAGDAFIALIKMLIAPIVFMTVALGIAQVEQLKQVGRVGAKAFLYFEVLSTIALAIGLLVVNFLQPGAGFHADPKALDASAVATFAQKAHESSTVGFLLHIIPKTFVDAFTGAGDLLQALFLALLFGVALNGLPEGPRLTVLGFLEALSQVFFRMLGLVMKLAPIGAGAAMAYTIGAYGIGSLGPLLKLMLGFYATCLLFVFGVLGVVAWWAGFSLWRFLRHIQDELLLVLGTSSSESALVPLMQKLEGLGCPKAIVGLVVPSGYAFNLDGTNIYLTMAALFVAQALDVPLSLGQQLGLLVVAMLTSKGASGVTGAGFITLAATLAVVPSVPVAGLALILGIDRFMSEARALTNLVGNGVACLVVSAWEGQLDRAKLQAGLQGPAEVGP